jgi:hypothetical protein
MTFKLRDQIKSVPHINTFTYRKLSILFAVRLHMGPIGQRGVSGVSF